MKKLATVLLLLVLSVYCFADETDAGPDRAKPERAEFTFGFDTGILSTSISYGTGRSFSFDLNANLAIFYFENSTTGLGLEFSPLNYSYSTNTKNHILSFSKLYINWNLNKIIGTTESLFPNLSIGPFFSIQTLNLVNFENFNSNISYSAGIKIAGKGLGEEETEGKFHLSVFSSNLELGYNYSNNRHGVYFTIGLSPAATAIFPILYFFLAAGGSIPF